MTRKCVKMPDTKFPNAFTTGGYVSVRNTKEEPPDQLETPLVTDRQRGWDETLINTKVRMPSKETKGILRKSLKEGARVIWSWDQINNAESLQTGEIF